MKYLLFVLLSFVTGSALAQPYPKCTYTYFKGSKKVATSQCFDAADRFGEARAFGPDGQEIYRHSLRHIAGHESVAFRFYPSGAVQQAYMSSAPDGGIQWYRSTTEFSELGAVTSTSHDNYDDNTTVFIKRMEPAPRPPTVPATPALPALPGNPPLPPANQCAALLQAECWFLNRSGRAAQVVVVHKTTAGQLVVRLPAAGRDTVRGFAYPLTQAYQAPNSLYTLAALPVGNSRAGLRVLPLARPYRNLNPNQRRYYFVVR